MSSDILDEIVKKRKEAISRLGYTFGIEIPETRTRPVVPFIKNKGTILEIKRASPSKGDIAPALDSAVTAKAYAKAGTSAISVLTEENYFKGSLKDLIAVCNSVDEYAAMNPEAQRVAVLRKDFLLEEEEIDIAYRCGADAVLLISRILPAEKMISMAKKCESLGITAFIELRLKEDLEKLAGVCREVNSSFIVTGVNARDLKDFSIDLLTPAGMLKEIRSIAGENAPVVFESGIRTPSAASFAGSLGFTGMLLGEAAARNPDAAQQLVSAFVQGSENKNSLFWLEHAEKVKEQKVPLVKICGLTNKGDALKAFELGASFLGFIFCAKSPRNVCETVVQQVHEELKACNGRNRVKLIAVITELDSEEGKKALDLQKQGIVDALQLHGMAETLLSGKFDVSIPHYAAVNVTGEKDLEKLDEVRMTGEPRILIDSKAGDKIGGTGTSVNGDLVLKVRKKTKLWLAGGVNPQNVAFLASEYSPELIDVSSGVESEPGKKDYDKMEKLFASLKTGE